jgi:hypothetical protein
MSHKEFPLLNDVLRLAENPRCNLDVDVAALSRMHRVGWFSAQVVNALWPNITPRLSAIYQGLPRYQGKPCRKCGGIDRYVAGCDCIVCSAKRSKDYGQKNREAKSKKDNEFNVLNAEYINLRQRAYRANNPEKFKVYGQRYRQKRKELSA